MNEDKLRNYVVYYLIGVSIFVFSAIVFAEMRFH